MAKIRFQSGWCKNILSRKSARSLPEAAPPPPVGASPHQAMCLPVKKPALRNAASLPYRFREVTFAGQAYAKHHAGVAGFLFLASWRSLSQAIDCKSQQAPK